MPATPPQVPIEVDSDTGVWSTDGIPMIYMPRHFFTNHHIAVEKALGPEAYAEILYEPGHRSAWQWCEREAKTHGLRGVDVFRHYMRRLSQRGWGQFAVQAVDEETGAARVRVDHSVFVYGHGPGAGRRVCYTFASWFPGALEWAGQDIGRRWKLRGAEVQCACEGIADHCVFETRPA